MRQHCVIFHNMYVTISNNPDIIWKWAGERERNSDHAGEMRSMTTFKNEDASEGYGAGKRQKFQFH